MVDPVHREAALKLIPWVDSPSGSATTGHNPETAPQLIGSADLTIPAGDTELTFADWPAAIGIDNLVLTTGACTPGTAGCSTNTPVPEPGTMPLLSASVALGGLAFGRRSFKQISPNLSLRATNPGRRRPARGEDRPDP
jgi:hypothetical protein